MARITLSTLGLLVLSLFNATNALMEVNVPASGLTYGSGTWKFADTGRYCSQDHYWTRGTQGSTVSYNFNGTSIAVHAFEFSDGAVVEIDLDGRKTTVNTHIATYNCAATIYSSTLPWGQHTLSIRTVDQETFYIRGLSYFTYDEAELASMALASYSATASSAQQSSSLTRSNPSGAMGTEESSSSSGGGRKKKSNAGAIGGGVAAAVVGTALILAIIITLIRRKKNKKNSLSVEATSTHIEWKPPPQPFQPLVLPGIPNIHGTAYGGFASNHPTGTTLGGSSYTTIGSYPSKALGSDRAIPGLVQQGYPTNTSIYTPPPNGVAQPLSSDPVPPPSSGYQGYPQPIQYGADQRHSVPFSPYPAYPASPQTVGSGAPLQQQQIYGGITYSKGPSRTPAPAYAPPPPAMYSHH